MTPAERLKGLDTFVAVAEAKSFTAAAERLNLSNSAVGKAIARLESRLNQQLFNRTTRRLEMTDAGEVFYKVCVRVLEELADAELLLSADELIPSGPLRIDLPATFGRLRVLPPLLAFTEKYPQILPSISFTDRFVDLVEDGIDVAVRIGGVDNWPVSVNYQYLGHEELIFCAAPSYLAQHPAPTNFAELCKHKAILYGKADGSSSPWLIHNGAQPVVRYQATASMVIGQAEAQVAAVAAGSGIAQLATWLVAEQIREGTLVNILPQLTTPGLPLHIVWLSSKQNSVKIQAVIAHLAEALTIN